MQIDTIQINENGPSLCQLKNYSISITYPVVEFIHFFDTNIWPLRFLLTYNNNFSFFHELINPRSTERVW